MALALLRSIWAPSVYICYYRCRCICAAADAAAAAVDGVPEWGSYIVLTRVTDFSAARGQGVEMAQIGAHHRILRLKLGLGCAGGFW